MVLSAFQVTFKSLESIEIHQTHYCKSGKYPPQVETGRQRPNSTVMPHARPSPAERREEEFSNINFLKLRGIPFVQGTFNAFN
jgi:hypothetical protein